MVVRQVVQRRSRNQQRDRRAEVNSTHCTPTGSAGARLGLGQQQLDVAKPGRRAVGARSHRDVTHRSVDWRLCRSPCPVSGSVGGRVHIGSPLLSADAGCSNSLRDKSRI